MINPPFNNARGAASSLQLIPPFSFKDVTASVFPVRANLAQLQRFCDQYLNQDSEDIRFEPFIPYVFLMLLDYGKMSIEAANMGWVSQNEVAFTVPLRWMVKKNGQWTFHDWAVNCPFIYVDNELSMSTGREVYGWPKVLARIDPSISEWVRDPHGVRRVFEVQAKVGGANKDDATSYRPLLSVRHRPVPNFLDMPPNLDGLMDPLTRAPNAALNLAKMSFDVFSAFSGMAFNNVTNSSRAPNLLDPAYYRQAINADNYSDLSDPANWPGGMQDLIWSLFPQMHMNTINFKQFRDASAPWTACYQAITNSRMEYKSINGGGPLGQQNLMLAQTDGGYEIDIYRHASQPVVESLGIEVENTRTDGGIQVSTLRPDFPFWSRVDLDYSRGKTMTWRTRLSNWQTSEAFDQILNDTPMSSMNSETSTDSSASTEEDDSENDRVVESEDTCHHRNPEGNPYNTARGAALQEIGGPFALPNTTVRVLPLMADENTLNQFVTDYLNVEGHTRFEAWGSYVYLVAYNYSRHSIENDVSLFSGREVNFAVPVKQYDWYDDEEYDLSKTEGRERRDEEKLVTTTLVCPFSYVDDASVAITSSEVHGAPTLRSNVGSPAHTWMDTSGPVAGRKLLKTSALVLPALGIGAGASNEAFLDVNTDSVLPPSDKAGWRRILANWGTRLVGDLYRKYGERGYRREQWSESDAFRHVRALALEVLTGKLSINNVSLKQFRDAWETDQACYQAIVKGRKTIDRLYELNEIEYPLNVIITNYPTQPVSKILGLIPKYTTAKKDAEVFEAIRPFWLRADITEHLGQTLYERVGEEHWTVQEHPEECMGWRNISLGDLRNVNDPKAKVRYQHRSGLHWVCETRLVSGRPEHDQGMDLEKLKTLDSNGELRNLQIYSREQIRPIMAEASTLNHIDRVHVPDLLAFLNERQGQSLSDETSASLGGFVGKVSPATILDSILSRQWGRPSEYRYKNNKADFGVIVDALGPQFKDELFPVCERRRNFWPLANDDERSTEHQRKGMAWQLWDDVWLLIEGQSEAFQNKAGEMLPSWFTRVGCSENSKKPGEWDSGEWLEIANNLKALVDCSHYEVSWPEVLRPLAEWQSVALDMHQQLSFDPKPDASGWNSADMKPNVAEVLEGRLHNLAAK